MGKQKKERLSRAGWRVGFTEELLGLSGEESAFIVLGLSASDGLSARRVARGDTQVELATVVAKCRNGDWVPHRGKRERGAHAPRTDYRPSLQSTFEKSQ